MCKNLCRINQEAERDCFILVIPAKAGILYLQSLSGFPIKSGMTRGGWIPDQSVPSNVFIGGRE